MKLDLRELGIEKNEIRDLVIKAIVDDIKTNTYMDEDGNEHSREEFVPEIKRTITKLISEKVQDAVSERLAMCLDEVLTGTFQPVDNWDQKVGPPTTLREIIKKRSETYLTEKVNSDGVRSQYGSPRLDLIIAERVKEALDYKFKDEISKEVARAKELLRTQVAKHITDTILKN